MKICQMPSKVFSLFHGADATEKTEEGLSIYAELMLNAKRNEAVNYNYKKVFQTVCLSFLSLLQWQSAKV